MATPNKLDVIDFIEVMKAYQPGEKLEVLYFLQEGSDLKPASRDWVGLFRVGWTSSRDYYTFEWVALLDETRKGSVTFAGRRLPPEDKHFYQFCYVSSDGRVRGASSPFQFSSIPALSPNVDDLELVEVSEDSLMILQPKEQIQEKEEEEVEMEKEDDTEVVENNKNEMAEPEEEEEVKSKEDSLAWKYEMVEREVEQKSELLHEMEKKVADLEGQLQVQWQSEALLVEELAKEKAQNHTLATSKFKEEEEVSVLARKLEQQAEVIATLQMREECALRENDKLKNEITVLKDNFRTTQKALNELQEVEVDLMTQIGEKNHELEVFDASIQKLKVQLDADSLAFNKERDLLLQELSVAQQNIAELLGAKEQGISIEELQGTASSKCSNEFPPTLPAPQGMVDKSVYEALQQAYENVEQYHYKATEENKNLLSGLHELKKQHEVARVKNEEYKLRIQKCRQEYEAKVKDNIELQRALAAGQGDTEEPLRDEVKSLRAKVRDMEENQEQVGKSWEEAIQELTQRKQELKKKAIQLAEMDNRMFEIEKQLQMSTQNFEDFQDKHDKVVNDKAAKVDQQQENIDGKAKEILELRCMISGNQKEKAKLESTVRQLREQLDALKASVRTTDERSCPVCSTKFPKRISQPEFERHVQAHFTTIHQ